MSSWIKSFFCLLLLFYYCLYCFYSSNFRMMFFPVCGGGGALGISWTSMKYGCLYVRNDSFINGCLIYFIMFNSCLDFFMNVKNWLRLHRIEWQWIYSNHAESFHIKIYVLWFSYPSSFHTTNCLVKKKRCTPLMSCFICGTESSSVN